MLPPQRAEWIVKSLVYFCILSMLIILDPRIDGPDGPFCTCEFGGTATLTCCACWCVGGNFLLLFPKLFHFPTFHCIFCSFHSPYCNAVTLPRIKELPESHTLKLVIASSYPHGRLNHTWNAWVFPRTCGCDHLISWVSAVVWLQGEV